MINFIVINFINIVCFFLLLTMVEETYKFLAMLPIMGLMMINFIDGFLRGRNND